MASSGSIFKSDPFRQAAGSAFGSIFDFFGNQNQKNPADSANEYFNRIPGTISPYYQPFINAGTSAIPQLQQQYGSLINNPGDILSRIGSGYQQSPGYQFALQQGLNGANNAASAGGMLGTPAAQQQSAQIANNIASQDYNNYLTNALGLYNTGLGGLNNLYQGGYNASNELASSLATILGAQAQNAYAGQANMNQQQGGLWGDLSSSLGELIPFGLSALFG